MIPNYFKYFLGISLLLLILWEVLAIFFPPFQYDFLYKGKGMPSHCQSEAEAIKRGVFLCDAPLLRTPYIINNYNDTLDIEESWVERRWSKGQWYWTTYLYKNDTNSFNINLIVKERYNIGGRFLYLMKNGDCTFKEYSFVKNKNKWGVYFSNIPQNDTLCFYKIPPLARNLVPCLNKIKKQLSCEV